MQVIRGRDKKAKERKKGIDLFNNIPSVPELVFPDGFYIDRDYVRVGKRYYRVYAVTDYPQSLYIGWLDEVKQLGNIDISVHIFPGEPRDVVNQLTRKITQYQSQYMLDEERGNIYDLGVLKKAVRDLEALREDIQMNRDKLYFVTIVLAVSADSPDELDKSSRVLEGVLAGKTVRARRAFLRQDQAYKTLVPVGENRYDDCARNFNTGAVISLFPFASPEFSHKKGVPLGVNLFTGSPVIFDNFIGPPALTNMNVGIFAQAGAGKSFLVKLLSLRGALLGIRTVFIDPEGEYSRLAEKVGGTAVKIKVNGRHVINPFELEEEEGERGSTVDILQKVNEVKNLVGMIVEGVAKDKLTAVELSVIEDTVQEVYREKGITGDPDSLYVSKTVSEEGVYVGRRKKEMPTLSDFAEKLAGKEDGKRIATILKPFLKGGTLGIFDGQSNVKLRDVPLVCFDISDIRDEFLRTYAMYVVTGWIWEKFAKKNVDVKKRIVVDEAWMFMKYRDTAHFLENLSRRARKRNTSLTVASQSFIEFSGSQEGRAVLTNAATVFLMRQAPADIDSVQEVFRLSGGQRDFLLSCGVGEALMMAGRNATALKVVASDYEKKFISTNPNDV